MNTLKPQTIEFIRSAFGVCLVCMCRKKPDSSADLTAISLRLPALEKLDFSSTPHTPRSSSSSNGGHSHGLAGIRRRSGRPAAWTNSPAISSRPFALNRLNIFAHINGRFEPQWASTTWVLFWQKIGNQHTLIKFVLKRVTLNRFIWNFLNFATVAFKRLCFDPMMNGLMD